MVVNKVPELSLIDKLNIFNYGFHEKFRIHLIEILRESRRKDITPLELLELQKDICANIIRIEKEISNLKTKADFKIKNEEWLKRETFRYHRRAIKDVCDGIAWRLFGHKRHILRQFTEHNRTGFIDENGVKKEIEVAEGLVKKYNCPLIINDTTNFLRFGDIIYFIDGKPNIEEVKTTYAARKSQLIPISKLLSTFETNIYKDNYGLDIRRVYIPAESESHFDKALKVIRKSSKVKTGLYGETVAPYLWMKCLSLSKSADYAKSQNGNYNFINYPAPFDARDNYFFIVSNIDYLDGFDALFAPYSVYPFPEEVIADILMLEYDIVSLINHKELLKGFAKYEYNIEYPDTTSLYTLREQGKYGEYYREMRNPKYFVTISGPDGKQKLPLSQFYRISVEYLSLKSLIKEIQFVNIIGGYEKNRPSIMEVDFELNQWR